MSKRIFKINIKNRLISVLLPYLCALKLNSDLVDFMKILQLCKKFPFPLKDGESIAVTYLSNALHEQGCEITLLSMNTTKHYTDLRSLPPDFNHYKAIYVTPLDNKIKVFDAFKNLFSRESYHIIRFVSKDFESKLIELLQRKNLMLSSWKHYILLRTSKRSKSIQTH